MGDGVQITVHDEERHGQLRQLVHRYVILKMETYFTYHWTFVLDAVSSDRGDNASSLHLYLILDTFPILFFT